MTTPEANEFFANRTVEEVGGDTEQSSTQVERIKSVSPDRRRKGRIVVTLHYDIPRDEWDQLDTDGVDVLRREIDAIKRRGPLEQMGRDEFATLMIDLLDGSVGLEIEAAK